VQVDSSGAAEPSPCKQAAKVDGEAVGVRGCTEAQDMSVAS